MYKAINPVSGEVKTVASLIEATTLCGLFNVMNGLHSHRTSFVDRNGQPAEHMAAFSEEVYNA